MVTAKFDLYRPEWLELVFDDRNKAYGAYDLRSHYAGNLVKAMGITFFSVALLMIGYTVLKPKPAPFERIIRDIPIIKLEDHHIKPPVTPPIPQTIQPHVQVATVRYPEYVVRPDKVAENPPKLIELETAAISSQNVKGKDGGDNISITDLGSGLATAPNVSEAPFKETYELQVQPEPYGGADAWAKFLQKNLRYPKLATEEGKSGKVLLSFIIETDGHISNVVVDRGAGYGMDEEAARVLKLAPAWKPGVQNGHHVRVRYTLPINFQITDQE
jgi:protein TonB